MASQLGHPSYKGENMLRPSLRFTQKTVIFLFLSLFFAATAVSAAKDPIPDAPPSEGHGPRKIITSSPAPGSALARADSLQLIGPWGSGAVFNGQFQDEAGQAAWNGWTHSDETLSAGANWQVSDYNAEGLGGHGAGNLALWCGDMKYDSCAGDDEDGGYGNDYNEIVTWTGMVADPTQSCEVQISAVIRFDLETSYDYVSLRVLRHDSDPYQPSHLTGTNSSGLTLNRTITLQPDEYMGPEGDRNQVVIQFVVESDGSYSDEDCHFYGVGACQIDDISVNLSNGGVSSFEDFQDGDMGDWKAGSTLGVGDFTQIRSNLEDVNGCNTNSSPQVCFIDDGTVVPGTGGSMCQSWCYGPGGYIVNNTGGLMGPGHFLNNKLISPVIEWPQTGLDGALLDYDVYLHQDFSMNDDPGMYHYWYVRSIDSGDPADLAKAHWLTYDSRIYGPPTYLRMSRDLSTLLVPGLTHMQVALAVEEYPSTGYGTDGTPAPYLDNVRLTAFTMSGPAMSAAVVELAQDGFPDAGVLDHVDLANNSVRFDMAASCNLGHHMAPHPGDSLVVKAVPRRLGATLTDVPKLHYRLKPNPAFDAVRSSGLPNEGAVRGFHMTNDRFFFDLPDTGFFFPGDELHYFFSATSDLDGDVRTATLPADTTGFSVFAGPLAYNEYFHIRALPSVSWDAGAERLVPEASTLMWCDGDDTELWLDTLDEIGDRIWRGVDVFITRDPADGSGQGLGTRATAEVMDGYETMIYTAGTYDRWTIVPHSNWDGSNDLGLLDDWLETGGRSLLLVGDSIVYDLATSSNPEGFSFVEDWLGIQPYSGNIRPWIGQQYSPRVLWTDDAPSQFTGGWIASGGCPVINIFDAMYALDGAQRIAEWTNPSGAGGAYSFAAAVLHDLPDVRTELPEHNSAIITVPVSLAAIMEDPQNPPPAGWSARRTLVQQVLDYFGEITGVGAAELPPVGELALANHPNPFNPSTTISYNLPRAGQTTIQVFDVKGHLVKTLVEGALPAGTGSVEWMGVDNAGARVASGVYFCAVKSDGGKLVNKMLMLK
jgi:hypothetical protein